MVSELVTQIIAIVTQWITGLVGMFVASFSGITEVFYNTSGDGPGEITFIGVFLLLGLAFTIVFFAFRFITSLIRK